MDCFVAFAPRNDGFIFQTHICILAALNARGLLETSRPLQEEGAGKTGCTPHPRSRVQIALTNAHTSIQVRRRLPAFPAQWLYGLLRALLGERAFLPPSPCGSYRKT